MNEPSNPVDTPTGVDPTIPHSARVWNFWLGGKDHYPADKELGEQILSAYPQITIDARAGRAFLVRTITHLAAEEGVRQFLDIGTGLPTHNNTHEIAQAAAPESRVVYVDNDPMVLAQARALLTGTDEGATAFVGSDLREPETVLAAARDLLDFDQPIGLSIIGTIGHIPDMEEAVDIVGQYVNALAPGSFLVFADGLQSSDPAEAEMLRQVNESEALTYRFSADVDEFARHFAGLELLDPGIVPTPHWRPETVEIGTPPETSMHGGVGRKP